MFGASAPAPKPADPSVIVEFGSLHTERPPEPPPAPAETPRHVAEPPPKAFEATLESTPFELEAKPTDAAPGVHEAKPSDATAPADPWVNPWQRTLVHDSGAARNLAGDAPPVAATPKATPTDPADLLAAGVPSGRPSKAVLILVGVVALLGGAALVVLLGRKPAPEPEKSVAAPAETTAAAAPSTAPTAAPNAPTAALPAATTAAPAESAPPAESAAAPAPSVAPVEGAAAAAAPTPEFDLTKLPTERAGLFVRSSVKTRVFVHGTEYGDTNTWLITSCGIRFVRLGHKLGDFVEPGRSYVVKCGKATELAIEPGK
jgi:hypothetical protein